MASSEPLKGKVVKSGPSGLGKVASGLDAFVALNNIVEATREYLVVREEATVKRREIDAYERLELDRIAAAERVLKDYFRQAFAERAQNVEALLVRYDQAIERGDATLAQAALSGVVDIAKTSPLADLGDLGQVRKALDDPDHVWEF
ncbi:hypothetical protein [Intrasporangium calvum]|uniref:Uncharacterized protein n=1 Tax=Intrasporangium calvum (strain ATCC 23552 / DSM 43043 / JCM 3097 / NBRC 12989 / NCIMB 10167 / NRRL B-3866 / 7 KIP) TaxID=710696 RepID=E6SC33_INTC7|nr:hypothetical protein [Intrasporangium calvum]ADU49573.1 hypothetical protein Intca_3087 [Intrasporangium calvum DSM 43043]